MLEIKSKFRNKGNLEKKITGKSIYKFSKKKRNDCGRRWWGVEGRHII
jgi:hypothetical protein